MVISNSQPYTEVTPNNQSYTDWGHSTKSRINNKSDLVFILSISKTLITNLVYMDLG